MKGVQTWLAGCLALLTMFAPIPAVLASPSPGLLPVADAEPAAGHFLVATRDLNDPNFAQTLVYLVSHGDDGSLGLIVNRASEIDLTEAAPELVPEEKQGHLLHFGGPVGLPMILVLARRDAVVDGMLHVAEGIHISSERPIIEAALAAASTPDNLRFYIGYAGWASGQLDGELLHGSWHVVPGVPEAVFAEDLETLWPHLIERLDPPGIQVETVPESWQPELARKPVM